MRNKAPSGGFRRNEEEKNEARGGVRKRVFNVLNVGDDENRKRRAIRPKTDLNIKGEFRSGKENVVR